MSAAGAPTERSWFGQPPGLTILFLTNMWEQFSYFGMRALLVYYMTTTLLFGQESASSVYGFYTAFAYFTPIIGGVIADRWLGKRKAVTIGAMVMAAGHFMMAFEPLFYPALATIALGNGLFLPTLPSQINDLYTADDPRRPWAYNVYYVGVNVGAFLAPLICGFLGETYGWHYGFGAAGVGMLTGLVIYLAGERYLPPERDRDRLLPAASEARAHRGRDTLLLLIGIGLAVTVFRGAYEQIGNTFALWMRDDVDRVIGGVEIGAAMFFSLNPLLVMVMTPLLLVRWRRQAERGRELSVMQKMAVGAALVASSYLLAAAAEMVAGDAPAHWLWLLSFFVIFTLGELYILPNGLGIFARLAPPKLGASTVAAWYFAIFTGSLAAGQVGRLWSRTGHTTFFVLLAGIALAAALFLLLLDRPARAVLERRAGAAAGAFAETSEV
ncbi:MAG TPA: peptide MFS transporter [Allosphingosinicella sp.]|nr:peptide MFS transporter [Allosphingosinicella sp.]